MNVLNVSDLTDAEAAAFINFITSQIVRCLILFYQNLQLFQDTNCTYSVLGCLKAYLGTMGLSVREEKEERINSKNQKKYYKRYYIEVM